MTLMVGEVVRLLLAVLGGIPKRLRVAYRYDQHCLSKAAREIRVRPESQLKGQFRVLKGQRNEGPCMFTAHPQREGVNLLRERKCFMF